MNTNIKAFLTALSSISVEVKHLTSDGLQLADVGAAIRHYMDDQDFRTQVNGLLTAPTAVGEVKSLSFAEVMEIINEAYAAVKRFQEAK